MSMTLKPKRSRPSLQLPQTPVEHPISSPSPSTDASESSDSDYEHFGRSLKPSHSDLTNTISSMPEADLRSIVRKLASTNPWFRNALVREFTHPTSAPSSPGQPNTSFNPVPRHFRRKYSHMFSLCANCNGVLNDESEAKTAVPGDFKRARHGTKPYHPGECQLSTFLAVPTVTTRLKIIKYIQVVSKTSYLISSHNHRVVARV
jgi:hypothetical protein